MLCPSLRASQKWTRKEFTNNCLLAHQAKCWYKGLSQLKKKSVSGVIDEYKLQSVGRLCYIRHKDDRLSVLSPFVMRRGT